jgi:hypothetical protein
MKKLLALTLSAGLATAGAQTFTTTGTGLNGVELGLTGGYAGGLSGEVFIHAPNVAGPLGVKAGVSFTRAADAINDASPFLPGISGPNETFGAAKASGLVTESGSRTVVGLDGTYNVGQLAPGADALIYAGGRYGMFRSTEDYGENGRVTYSSNAFGIGAGVMVSYPLSGNLSLVGDLGIDQFFRSNITATTTSADGSTTVDSGEGTNEAFGERFVRPGTVFKARIGIKTSF